MGAAGQLSPSLLWVCQGRLRGHGILAGQGMRVAGAREPALALATGFPGKKNPRGRTGGDGGVLLPAEAGGASAQQVVEHAVEDAILVAHDLGHSHGGIHDGGGELGIGEDGGIGRVLKGG